MDECAAAILRLLDDPDLARRLGHGGRERVRANYLPPRLLLDELHLIHSLLAG